MECGARVWNEIKLGLQLYEWVRGKQMMTFKLWGQVELLVVRGLSS